MQGLDNYNTDKEESASSRAVFLDYRDKTCKNYRSCHKENTGIDYPAPVKNTLGNCICQKKHDNWAEHDFIGKTYFCRVQKTDCRIEEEIPADSGNFAGRCINNRNTMHQKIHKP